MKELRSRLAILVALVLGLAPLCLTWAAGDSPPLKTDFYNGKVVPLVELLNKRGAKLDADAALSTCRISDASRNTWMAAKVAFSAGRFRIATTSGAQFELPQRQVNFLDYSQGKLTYLSSTPTERQPRGFAIDPKGKFLVAAGKNRTRFRFTPSTREAAR